MTPYFIITIAYTVVQTTHIFKLHAEDLTICRNPFELNEQSKITQYIQNHSENINVINNSIHNKLLDKESRNLGRINQG